MGSLRCLTVSTIRRYCSFSLCMALWLTGAAYANSFEITISKDGKNDLDALPAALVRGAQEAYSINKLGLDALDKGNLDSAMACFSKASSMLPIYSEAENNKAVVHFRRGNIPIAKMIWESVVNKDPDCAVALYNLGVVGFYDNDFTSALDYFKKAVAKNKKFPEAFVMLGRTMLKMDKKREACVFLKEAVALDKNLADAWQYCAFAYLNVGDTAAAQALLLKYKDPEALKLLGQIEAARNNFAAASVYLGQAVSGGALPELLTDLAEMQLEAKKYKDALVAMRSYEKKVKKMSEDAYCIAGIAAKEMGDVDMARTYFEKGVKLYPQSAVLRYNLGQIYFYQKKFDQAESAWKSLSDTMQDPSLYYMKALSAKQRGALDEARQNVQQALKIDEKAEYFDLLGVIDNAQGKKDEAIVNFKKALKADPDLRSAQLNLSLLTQSNEGLEEAAAELEKQRRQCSIQCGEISLQESIVLFHLGKIDKAAALLDALPEEQKNLKITRHSALYYSQLHDWEKAVVILEKGKKKFVFDAKTDYELAEDYLLSGHYAKAVEAFKSVLGIWDENPWRIYYRLGYAYMEQNDLQKAKSNFELSLKSKPDNIAARGVLGYVYHLEGNSALAQSMWEKNLRDDPSNPMLHINLGLSMEKDGRYEEALDHYNKARALSPNDVSLLINIGNVYEAMNRFPEAAHAYTQALSSNKKDLAGYDLFLLSQKSGNAAVAKDMHQMLIKEFPASAYTKRAQADMHFKEGDTAKGISALESISDKDPVDWYTLARVYSDQADEKKTEQCLAMLPKEPIWDKAKTQIDAQKAFAAKDFNLAYSLLAGLHDTGFSVQYNCALAALQAKKYPEAVAIGETLVQKAKGKDRGDVCRVVGNAYFGLKQWKNAKQWYEQLAGMERNDAVVQYNCAVAAYNLDDVDGAWEYYQKARELNSSLSNKDIENKYASKHGSSRTDTAAVDSLDVLYNGAVTLQRDAKNDSAAELIYKKILDQKNDYYRAWNNLGAIFSERGELQEALRCFLRSIEKQHDIPEAYANLVNVYIAMDSLSSAQRWTTKGMGHNPDNDMLKELDARVKELMKTKKKKRRTAKETEG